MGAVIEINGWRAKKLENTQVAPALECPQCGTEVLAANVQADSTTAYRCEGPGHRAFTWRIDADGNMLRGFVGRRYY